MSAAPIVVEAAPRDAMADLAQALAEAKLPTDDLAAPDVCVFRVRDSRGVVGYGGIQGAGADVLLRSLVVPPARRGEGQGAALVRLIAAEAARAGARRLWLLTESAAPFFARLGFQAVSRAQAPAAIAAAEQFRSLCPSSATLMTADIEDLR